VFSNSTLVVTGHYLTAGTSGLVCSVNNSPDADDILQIGLRDADGTTELTTPVTVATGSDADGNWHSTSTALEESLGDLSAYAGETLQLRWQATNDTDNYGTYFYIDDVSAQLCTKWSIPDAEPGMGAFGGKVTTRGENNVPTIITGADVWAYSQGGQVLHTVTIHDGTYHFYNVTPGTYIVYSESWVGGSLRTVSTSVEVAADSQIDDLNLLLQ
jgi:hypothetical protein